MLLCSQPKFGLLDMIVILFRLKNLNILCVERSENKTSYLFNSFFVSQSGCNFVKEKIKCCAFLFEVLLVSAVICLQLYKILVYCLISSVPSAPTIEHF